MWFCTDSKADNKYGPNPKTVPPAAGSPAAPAPRALRQRQPVRRLTPATAETTQVGGHTSGEHAATIARRAARSRGAGQATAPLHLVRRHRPAVVGERQVDDRPRLQAARRPRSTQRGGVPSGASTAGRWCRFINASAASGRHRATSRSARSPAAAMSSSRSPRSASPTSGSWRRVASKSPPLDRLALLLGHEAQVADHHGLTRLECRGVEAGRPAQAQRVAVHRQRQPGVRGSGATRARTSRWTGRAAHRAGAWRPASSSRTWSVCSWAAQPRGEPPRERLPSGGGGHGSDIAGEATLPVCLSSVDVRPPSRPGRSHAG